MARTVGGEMYSWGKGLRGQLGLGSSCKFSLAPRKVTTFASSVLISSGYAHNVCITTPRKYVNPALAERGSHLVPAIEGGGVNVFSNPVEKELTLAKLESRAMRSFDCCRRKLNSICSKTLRYQQLRLHPSKRLTAKQMAYFSRLHPYSDSRSMI
jgi:hypothetical protein